MHHHDAITTTGALVIRSAGEAYAVRRSLNDAAGRAVMHGRLDEAAELVSIANRAGTLEAGLLNLRETDSGLYALAGASS